MLAGPKYWRAAEKRGFKAGERQDIGALSGNRQCSKKPKASAVKAKAFGKIYYSGGGANTGGFSQPLRALYRKRFCVSNICNNFVTYFFQT
jgi:hypothetical protein